MSVYFIGCPHLGHKNIARYRSFVKNTHDNTNQCIESWEKTINKKDTVFVMGDAAFDTPSLELMGKLPGKKILLKGNHDDYLTTRQQVDVFDEIHGILKYKGMWLTHCPIHPAEIRNSSINVHAHVHIQTVMKGVWRFKKPDPRYLNVCADVIVPEYGSWFISLDQVRDKIVN